MKKRLFFLLSLMLALPLQAEISSEIKIEHDKAIRYGFNMAQLAYAMFLFVGGSWLAHRQLPRLAGQEVEYNAPIFTKIFASGLFVTGALGGIVGAWKLRSWINKHIECE